MIVVNFKRDFRKSTKYLNAKQLEKLSYLIVLLSENPFYHELHTKNLSGYLLGLFSFRINREWRVLFKFSSPKEILIIKVGHRKDIYK